MLADPTTPLATTGELVYWLTIAPSGRRSLQLLREHADVLRIWLAERIRYFYRPASESALPRDGSEWTPEDIWGVTHATGSFAPGKVDVTLAQSLHGNTARAIDVAATFVHEVVHAIAEVRKIDGREALARGIEMEYYLELKALGLGDAPEYYYTGKQIVFDEMRNKWIVDYLQVEKVYSGSADNSAPSAWEYRISDDGGTDAEYGEYSLINDVLLTSATV